MRSQKEFFVRTAALIKVYIHGPLHLRELSGYQVSSAEIKRFRPIPDMRYLVDFHTMSILLIHKHN